MQFYQWLVPIIALYYIYRLTVQYRANRRLAGSTIVWIVFWIISSFLALMPDLVSFKVANLLGIKSNINAVIFVALGFLFIFMFYLTAIIEKMERQFSDTIRHLALENQRLKEEQQQQKKKESEGSLRD